MKYWRVGHWICGCEFTTLRDKQTVNCPKCGVPINITKKCFNKYFFVEEEPTERGFKN